MEPSLDWHPPSRSFDIDLWLGKPMTDQRRSGRRRQSSRSLGVLDTDMFDGDGMELPKADAIEAKQICACHVMSIGGWAADRRWKVQDSHGLDTGPDGHYVMTDGWFDAFILSAVIRKKYLSPELLALLEHPIYIPKEERF